eukprot:6899891-Alexandrium_andersonii.AAC.1
MIAAQKKYSDEVKGKKGHKMGSPDMWSWRAAVMVAHAALPDGQAAKAALANYLAEQVDPSKHVQVVNHVKARPCYAEGKGKLEFSLDQSAKQVFDVVHEYVMSRKSVEAVTGKAPRGKQERDVQ